MNTPKAYDFMNTILTKAPKCFKECNFTILCDKYTIKSGFSNYNARGLYVSLQANDKCVRFYPDKLKEWGLEWVCVNRNLRRKIEETMDEFYINGNTELHQYNDISYYNYSIALAPQKQKLLIE